MDEKKLFVKHATKAFFHGISRIIITMTLGAVALGTAILVLLPNSPLVLAVPMLYLGTVAASFLMYMYLSEVRTENKAYAGYEWYLALLVLLNGFLYLFFTNSEDTLVGAWFMFWLVVFGIFGTIIQRFYYRLNPPKEKSDDFRLGPLG